MRPVTLDPEYLPIIDKVKDQKHRYNPAGDLEEIALRKPESILGFVAYAMHKLPLELHGSWIAIVDWLPAEDWDQLATLAVKALDNKPTPPKHNVSLDFESHDILSMIEQVSALDYESVFGMYHEIAGTGGKNNTAESVIKAASNQSCQSLHPHLKQLFNYVVHNRTGFATEPFRDSKPADYDFLWDIIYDEEASDAEQVHAFYGLLETRNERVFNQLLPLSDRIGFARYLESAWGISNWTMSAEEYASNRLKEVGFMNYNNSYQQLYYEPTWCIRQATNSYQLPAHPTWNAANDPSVTQAESYVTTTNQCLHCKQTMIKLITIPETIKIQFPELLPDSIELCLLCSYNYPGSIYFQIDSQGNTSTQFRVEPDYVSDTEPQHTRKHNEVIFSKIEPRWYHQDWGSSGGANMYRFGGPPSWVQSAEYPKCPQCDRTMKFLMQHILGYPEPATEHDSQPSDGLTYYFWCADCRIHCSILQMT